jgi:hypothetical protein
MRNNLFCESKTALHASLDRNDVEGSDQGANVFRGSAECRLLYAVAKVANLALLRQVRPVAIR